MKTLTDGEFANFVRLSTSLQQHVELILGDYHPELVAGVNHEDDALALLKPKNIVNSNEKHESGSKC